MKQKTYLVYFPRDPLLGATGYVGIRAKIKSLEIERYIFSHGIGFSHLWRGAECHWSITLSHMRTNLLNRSTFGPLHRQITVNLVRQFRKHEGIFKFNNLS